MFIADPQMNIRHIHGAEHKDVISFLVNSVSTKSKITVPQVSGDKIVINLDDYGIPTHRWDNVMKGHPYGEKVRADWFVAHFGDNYYKLTGMASFVDFYEKTKYAEKMDLETRAVLSKSKVAKDDVTIIRTPTPFGSVWEEKIGKESHWMGFIANGLLAYALTNERMLTDVGDPRFSVASIQTCFSCHEGGIPTFKDDYRELMKKGVRILTVEERLGKMFLADIDALVLMDRKRYNEAVQKAANDDADGIRAKIKLIQDKYNEPITKSVAIAELGVTEEQFEKMAESTYNLEVIKIYKDIPVNRRHWEDFFSRVSR